MKHQKIKFGFENLGQHSMKHQNSKFGSHFTGIGIRKKKG